MNVCQQSCAVRRQQHTQPSHSSSLQQAHAWLLRNCFSNNDDIIDWTKYAPNPLNCLPSIIQGGIFTGSKSVQKRNTYKSITICPINEPTIQQRDIPTSDQSAITHNDNKSPPSLAELFYERKESPITGIRVLISLSLVLAILGRQPISQNAVSCLGSVPGGSIIRNDHNMPHNYPVLHSTHRSMNLNQPFWISTSTTNNPNLNYHHHPMGDPTTFGGGLPTSAIESFYSDQNSHAAQSSVAPIANGWSPSMIPSNSPTNVQDSLDVHLKNILVPRVSGSPGNVKVRQYIVDSLEANEYTVQLDEFTDNTPMGKVKFANVIAYSNPNACRQLVLACHYDSKMMDGFLGAVDSAVPCAMLLKMSETFKATFRTNDGESTKNSLGLQFVFFDGEEAFVQWGPTDSLYGSRHLAAKWHKQKPPQHCSGTNELSRIELLVLLDLIGSKDTSFIMYSSFDSEVNRRLQAHHNNFRKYERAYLTGSGLTASQANREAAFRNRQMPINLVEDDHVPFLKRGVPILSLLASPFPKVWHTIADNYDAIDFPKTRRILHVLEEWLANYEQKPA